MRANPTAICVMLAVALTSGACRQDMHDQAKYEPLEESSFFDNGMASRPLIEGTIAREMPTQKTAFHTGRTPNDEFVTELPMELERALLDRGRSRFDAFCSPCHGQTGDGLGMIVRRGFKQPTSFHDQRLRESPVGYYFDVMSNGFGQMSSYASQIPAQDRWAIAAYISALQLSQNIPVDSLSAEEQQQLDDSRGISAEAHPRTEEE
ncbi:MAG: cytochrome c [Thermoanaerobaculia bacterium]